MSMQRRATHVATATGIALLVAACGSDGDTSEPASPPASQSAAPAPALAGHLVYVEEGTGINQLYSIRPDGSGRTQITHLTQGEAANPDWAHDGSRLTYEASIGDHAGVFVSQPDGSDAQDLTPEGFQGQPAFSPDGKTIAFEREAGGNGLALMDADGSNVRRLTRNPFTESGACGCDTDPNFSPDGRVVTFVRVKVDEQLAALFSIRTDGTGLRRLTPYSWDVAVKHDWSPDGKRIALTTEANSGASANIVTISPTGGAVKHLTSFDDGRSAFVGSYSPDGKHLAFRLEHGGAYDLATMNADGTGIQTVSSSTTIKPRFIDWGP